jgi:prevent-host-death family protein
LTIVINGDTLSDMEEMAISRFKATCLAVLKRVRKTGKPILVTKFGEPVAQVAPPPPRPRPRQLLGAMTGTMEIHGDIISPASDEQDWDALRP